MIVFTDSHVDLMGNTTMSAAQVAQRWDRELLRKWSKVTQDNLRDFMQIKASLDPETFPNYAENEAMLAEFIADKASLYAKRVDDETKADLLNDAIEYEQAVRDVAAITLRIEGRDAVDEIPEEIDPETGEITQPYVPAVEAVAALPATIEVDNQVVDNPEYVSSIEQLEAVESIVTACSPQVLEVVALRV